MLSSNLPDLLENSNTGAYIFLIGQSHFAFPAKQELTFCFGVPNETSFRVGPNTGEEM